MFAAGGVGVKEAEKKGICARAEGFGVMCLSGGATGCSRGDQGHSHSGMSWGKECYTRLVRK